MSAFSDFVAEGFALMAEQCGTPITVGEVTRSCILSPFIQTREARDSGFWDNATSTAELLRTDAELLGLTIENGGTVVSVNGRAMCVVGIDDDPADPCVRVHLRPER